MARRTSAPALDPADLDRLATALVETIRRDGSLAVSKLASHGIPKSARTAVLARCAHDGLEVGPRLVRVPLQDQLRARLRDGAALAMRTLSTAIQGATKKDATNAALALVESGEAKLVLRGTEATLMAPATRVVQGAEARRPRESPVVADQGHQGRTEGPGVSAPVRRSGELVARLRPTAPAIGVDDVLEHARRLSLETGLTFVPSLVRALGGGVRTGPRCTGRRF